MAVGGLATLSQGRFQPMRGGDRKETRDTVCRSFRPNICSEMWWLHAAPQETPHVPEQAAVFWSQSCGQCSDTTACICSPPSLPHFPFSSLLLPLGQHSPTEYGTEDAASGSFLRNIQQPAALCSVLDSTHCRLAAGAPFLGSSHLPKAC